MALVGGRDGIDVCGGCGDDVGDLRLILLLCMKNTAMEARSRSAPPAPKPSTSGSEISCPKLVGAGVVIERGVVVVMVVVVKGLSLKTSMLTNLQSKAMFCNTNSAVTVHAASPFSWS